MKLFVICLLIIPLLSDDCQPLYWQSDPNYQVPLDQTAIVAANQLVMGDVVTATGIIPARTKYTVFDIKGKGVYDDSNVKVNIANQQISVTGGVIDLTFQLYTMVTPPFGKGYDGNGTASLNNITVNYTKKPALIKGAAIWTLSNLSPSIPNNLIPNNDYAPPFQNKSDKTQFDNLISTDLYSEVSAYYNMNLSTLYAQALQSQALSKTFNTSTWYAYTYPNTNVAININVSVSNFNISDDGVVLGYYGQVQGHQKCSQFKPDLSLKASFITKQLISGIWQGFAQSNVWQPNSLDQSLIRSQYFKFKMVDLIDIIPSATYEFGNLLQPLVARCNLLTKSPDLIFDQNYQVINTTLSWDCNLYRTADVDKSLIKLSLTIDYRIIVQQIKNQLSVRIASSSLASSEWAQTSYTLTNKDLANIYLKDVVSSLSNVEVLGTGFLQPKRSSPKVTIKSDYIVITDEKSILSQE